MGWKILGLEDRSLVGVTGRHLGWAMAAAAVSSNSRRRLAEMDYHCRFVRGAGDQQRRLKLADEDYSKVVEPTTEQWLPAARNLIEDQEIPLKLQAEDSLEPGC